MEKKQRVTVNKPEFPLIPSCHLEELKMSPPGYNLQQRTKIPHAGAYGLCNRAHTGSSWLTNGSARKPSRERE